MIKQLEDSLDNTDTPVKTWMKKKERGEEKKKKKESLNEKKHEHQELVCRMVNLMYAL